MIQNHKLDVFVVPNWYVSFVLWLKSFYLENLLLVWNFNHNFYKWIVEIMFNQIELPFAKKATVELFSVRINI